MKTIKRREFFRGLASTLFVPFAFASDLKAGNKNFRFVLPNGEKTLTVGETVPLRVLTKTAFPRLSVTFKANGQVIGTANGFPYQINWTPSQTGDYALTAEIAGASSNTVLDTTVKVFNLLYDGIGRRGNRLHNVENHYISYQTTAIPEANGYGFPMNYLATLNTARTIRLIEVVLSATTHLYNDWRDIRFPNFNYVMARFWNDGATGFQRSPRAGTLIDYSLGAPNFGSTSDPLTVNSQGIKYYLTGWSNLNIPLPAGVPVAMSLQFSINSLYDFTEMINIAASTLPAQDLYYASGRMSPSTINISSIGATAVRIWTD